MIVGGMAATRLRPLARGAYVGDVTALCALSVPPPPSPPPPSQKIGGVLAGVRRIGTGTEGRAEEGEYAEPTTTLSSISADHDTLLAGVGASLQWYDPFGSGGEEPLLTVAVFGAARVHGIVPAPQLDDIAASCDALNTGGEGGNVSNVGDEGLGSRGTRARAVLVWGERRVALVALRVGRDVRAEDRRVHVVTTLPPLGHWVHDVRPLASEDSAAGSGVNSTPHHRHPTVAVGLADNAVEQWTMPGRGGGDGGEEPRCLRRVECAMRSMLYSLALRGSSMADLEVAGGTIFNEVQLWAPGACEGEGSDTDGRSKGKGKGKGKGEVDRPEPWAVLRGHEGSIMRVSWAADGAHVYSTSDDRTARVWVTPPRHRPPGTREMLGEVPRKAVAATTTGEATQYVTGARVTVFGHTARVWDCQLAMAGRRPLLATAGEDCTVRLWDAPRDIIPGQTQSQCLVGAGGAPAPTLLDKPVAVLRGHRGRGVWRALALRAPGGGGLLVTAGADASIKLWDLSGYSSEPGAGAGAGIAGRGGGEQEENDCSLEICSGPALPPGTSPSQSKVAGKHPRGSGNDLCGGACDEAKSKSDEAGGESSGGGGSCGQTVRGDGDGGVGVTNDSKGEYIRAVCLATPGKAKAPSGDVTCVTQPFDPSTDSLIQC